MLLGETGFRNAKSAPQFPVRLRLNYLVYDLGMKNVSRRIGCLQAALVRCSPNISNPNLSVPHICAAFADVGLFGC